MVSVEKTKRKLTKWGHRYNKAVKRMVKLQARLDALQRGVTVPRGIRKKMQSTDADGRRVSIID